MKWTSKDTKIATVMSIGAILLWNTFFQIRSGQRGIVFTFGKITSVANEGLRVKLPFIQTIEKISVRTQKREADAEAVSKNLQPVKTTITINYFLSPTDLKTLYETTGFDVDNKIIHGRIQESVKAICARYTAEELVIRRAEVKDEIAHSITSQLGEYYIVVPSGGIQVTNFNFSPAFNKAIEDKQIAEQQALKAANDLQRIKVEAEQKVAEAKGSAEAIRIQAEAIQRQGGKDYVQLKAVEKWNGELPHYFGSSGPMPFLDIKR